MLQYRRYICRSARHDFDAWIKSNPLPAKSRRGLQHAAEVENLRKTPAMQRCMETQGSLEGEGEVMPSWVVNHEPA